MSSEERERQLIEEHGIVSAEVIKFSEMLIAFLKNEKDEGTHIDTGGGFGMRDIWVKYGGREFMVTVKATQK